MNDEIVKLINGNVHFRKKFFEHDTTLFDALVSQGQQPKVMIIACSDSRIDPAMIFNCQPGELFVVRNVANLVPPCEDTDTYHGTSAALQFGTCFLEVEHIIVLGHSQCGGIRALVEGFDSGCQRPKSFITKWMEIARPAHDALLQEHEKLSLDEKMHHAEQYALVHSLNNIATFPWIVERIAQGTLQIHAWYFDLKTGMIHRYNARTKQWSHNEI